MVEEPKTAISSPVRLQPKYESFNLRADAGYSFANKTLIALSARGDRETLHAFGEIAVVPYQGADKLIERGSQVVNGIPENRA
ncbi:hypothetical protein GCM10017621_33950 [Maricaulis virginensis]|uniref:Uncharacterized protein n=1 Tax=Maricaulis virginensis TaxID=144022 RepID=A0A9W6IQM0_9PROT|nr:hypothetical protein GCM10017621_33950 [Maricaulis virginensis]